MAVSVSNSMNGCQSGCHMMKSATVDAKSLWRHEQRQEPGARVLAEIAKNDPHAVHGCGISLIEHADDLLGGPVHAADDGNALHDGVDHSLNEASRAELRDHADG